MRRNDMLGAEFQRFHKFLKQNPVLLFIEKIHGQSRMIDLPIQNWYELMTYQKKSCPIGQLHFVVNII